MLSDTLPSAAGAQLLGSIYVSSRKAIISQSAEDLCVPPIFLILRVSSEIRWLDFLLLLLFQKEISRISSINLSRIVLMSNYTSFFISSKKIQNELFDAICPPRSSSGH